MKRLAIFITGGAVVALELIASRVLNPFFGVSLYIWTGILSTTLLCLAIGYYFGGVVARRMTLPQSEAAYYLMPAIGSLGLGISCALYPIVLGPLARFDLIIGSLIACLFLLGVPLIAMSAMNPLLVAIEHAGSKRRQAEKVDAGAGAVFFISTVGSVAGVIVAAFTLIPNLSNRTSIAATDLVVGLIAIIGVIAAGRNPNRLRLAAAITGAGGMLLGAYIVLLPVIRPAPATASDDTGVWTVEQSYPSSFGTLKTIDLALTKPAVTLRFLENDGMLQNIMFADGRSAALFTYMLGDVTKTLVPQPRRVLVLGLGAGFVPTYFADAGAQVDVAEINGRMVDIAADWFHFKRRPEIDIHTVDARTLVHSCTTRYDVIAIDLFAGDGIPEHLATQEFFTDIRNCLAEGGIVAMNTFLDTANVDYSQTLLTTITSVFGSVLFLPEVTTADEPITSGYIFAGNQAIDRARLTDATIDWQNFPPIQASRLRASLRQLATVTYAGLASHRRPATDENNPMAVVGRPSQASYRAEIVRSTPAAMLAN